MQFPRALFKQAGLNPIDIASLFGVSRVTGWRWLTGVDRHGRPTDEGGGVHLFLRDRVTKVAAQVQGAVNAGVLPDPSIQAMEPEARATKIKRILKQYRMK